MLYCKSKKTYNYLSVFLESACKASVAIEAKYITMWYYLTMKIRDNAALEYTE